MKDSPISSERMEYLRKQMRDKLGWTDEELDRLSPRQWQRIDVTGRIQKNKVIAEVVRAHHCELQAKPGDKIVTRGGMVILEETTFPSICIGALAHIYPLVQGAWQLLVTGQGSDNMFMDHVQCVDVGPEQGGLGEVLFRVYCEEA
ncbi:hypothetical protein ACFLWX_01900 [Chloroflexota bacterium]